MAFVVMAPLVLFVVLLVVQLALWLHTRQVAEHAASRAAQMAAVDGGSVEEARAAALGFVDSSGGPLVAHRAVTVETDGVNTRAEVTVRFDSLVPGLSFSVAASSSSPVERFVAAP